jgi:hypothetical protein
LTVDCLFFVSIKCIAPLLLLLPFLFIAENYVSEGLAEVGVEDSVNDWVERRVEVTEPCDEELDLQSNTVNTYRTYCHHGGGLKN